MTEEKELIRILARGLLKAPCHFRFCEGWKKEIQPMATCHRCAALHKAFKQCPELEDEVT